MDNVKKFDIVLPLYSPHEGWGKTIADSVSAIRRYFAGKDCEIHVYITNDGAPLSRYPEESLQLIREAAGGHLHFLPCELHRGKGFSLRFLIARTEGDYQVYTDGDFPFGWESVARAFELLESGADVVMGRRGKDYNGALPFLRKLLSGGAHILNICLLGIPGDYVDTQAGIKGFNKAGREVFLRTTVDTFVFDTEFILLACKKRLEIVPQEVHIRPGLSFSSMGLRVMMRELFFFLRILVKIRILHKY